MTARRVTVAVCAGLLVGLAVTEAVRLAVGIVAILTSGAELHSDA